MHLCLRCNAVVRSVAKTSRANEEAEIMEDWSDLRENKIIKVAGWKLQSQEERSSPSAEVLLLRICVRSPLEMSAQSQDVAAAWMKEGLQTHTHTSSCV